MNLPEGYIERYSRQLSLQTRNEFGLGMGECMGMVDLIHFCVRDCQLSALKSLLRFKKQNRIFPRLLVARCSHVT